ncbi:hypothetical protein R3P38DRAFT_3193255 [Favolaschia claudopus]|uniref:Uncharacterized protein n=1 Tax=Favolaschia claudopus TaxID=2862362 RepID=A0AAW0BIM1_9AGAR
MLSTRPYNDEEAPTKPPFVSPSPSLSLVETILDATFVNRGRDQTSNDLREYQRLKILDL